MHAFTTHAAHAFDGVFHAFHNKAFAGLEHIAVAAQFIGGDGTVHCCSNFCRTRRLRAVANHAAHSANGVGNGTCYLPVQFRGRLLFTQKIGNCRTSTAGRADRTAIGGQAADILLLMDGNQIKTEKRNWKIVGIVAVVGVVATVLCALANM